MMKRHRVKECVIFKAFGGTKDVLFSSQKSKMESIWKRAKFRE